MSTAVDILCFYKHLYNQLLKVKHAFNLETLTYRPVKGVSATLQNGRHTLSYPRGRYVDS